MANQINQTAAVDVALLENMAETAWQYGNFQHQAFTISMALCDLLKNTSTHHSALLLAETLHHLAINLSEQEDIKVLSGKLFDAVQAAQLNQTAKP